MLEKSGGAGSLERTRLCSISLLCREKTGNFYKIRAFWGLGPQVSHWKCADFLENSLRAITGKFFARTGNFFEETGNLSPVSGKLSVVDPQVQILGTIRDLFTCTAAPLRSSSCRARAMQRMSAFPTISSALTPKADIPERPVNVR